MGVLTDLGTMGGEGAFGGAVKKRLTPKRSDASTSSTGSADRSDDSDSGGGGGGGAMMDAYSAFTDPNRKKRSNGKRS